MCFHAHKLEMLVKQIIYCIRRTDYGILYSAFFRFSETVFCVVFRSSPLFIGSLRTVMQWKYQVAENGSTQFMYSYLSYIP